MIPSRSHGQRRRAADRARDAPGGHVLRFFDAAPQVVQIGSDFSKLARSGKSLVGTRVFVITTYCHVTYNLFRANSGDPFRTNRREPVVGSIRSAAAS